MTKKQLKANNELMHVMPYFRELLSRRHCINSARKELRLLISEIRDLRERTRI